MPVSIGHHSTTPQATRPAGGRRASRSGVVSRLWRTAERQVCEIETRLAGLGDDPAALERDAKTLAIIARTVRDLVAIDQDRKPAALKDSHAETGPRDLDQFRTELAQRLDDLRRERAGEGAA